MPRRFSSGSGLIVACAVSLALIGVVQGVAHLRFETNDDPGLIHVVSGVVTGQPEPTLVYSNILLGAVLSGAYGVSREIPWYGLALYLVHGLSCAGLLFAFFARRRHLRGAVGFGVTFALFVFPLWHKVQFTSVAMLAGGAGAYVLLAAAIAARDRDGARETPAAVFGVALIVLGALVRFKAGVLGAVLVGATLGPFVVRRDELRPFALRLGGALALSAAMWAVDAGYYNAHEPWREYRAFNALRSQLHDTARVFYRGQPTACAREHLEEWGWTENDALSFARWFLVDPDVYSKERLERIVRDCPARIDVGAAARRQVERMVNRVATFGVWVTLSVGLVLLLVRWRFAAAVALMGVAVGGLWCLLAWRFKLPFRLGDPMFALLGAAPLIIYSWLPRALAIGRRRRVASAVAIAVAVIVIGWGVGRNVRRHIVWDRDHARDRARMAAALDILEARMAERPETRFVLAGIALRFEWLDPLGALPLRGLPVLPVSGWLTRSPLVEKRLRAEGIEDIYRFIATNPSAWLLGRADTMESIARFVSEHREGLEVRPRLKRGRNYDITDAHIFVNAAVSADAVGQGRDHETRRSAQR